MTAPTGPPHRTLTRYGLALLASGAALVVRLVLTSILGPGLPTYVFFFPAVMLAAMLWGGGPGVAATATSALLVAYWVFPRVGALRIASPLDMAGLLIFLCMGGGMSVLAARYHQGRARAVASAAEAARVLHAQQLDAVREVSTELTRELDLARLLQLIAQRAVNLGKATSGTIRLWDAEACRLAFRAWAGERAALHERDFALGEGVAGTAAQRRSGLIVNDFRTSPYATPELLATSTHHAVLAEPLLYREELIGVVTLNRREADRPFTGADGEILRLLANQAAVAIVNARLHQAALRRGQELEAILTAAHTIEASLDLEARLREIVQQAATLTGAAAARILLVEDEGRSLRARVGIGPEGRPEEPFSLSIAESFSGEVARTGRPLAVSDTRSDPRLRLHEHVEHRAYLSYLGLPMMIQGRLRGVLVLNTTTPRTYPQGEIDLLMLFASQAAIAIENARLFGEEQHRRQQLEAVRAISEEITRELDLQQVLGLVVQRALALVGADSGGMFLWSEEGQFLTTARWEGAPAKWQTAVRFRPGEGVVGTVVLRREGLRVNDYRRSPYAHPAILAETDFTAVLAEPLVYRDRFQGVILLTRTAGQGPFTGDDQVLLRLFATHAAIAVENARLLDAAVRRSRELEAVRTVGAEIIRELDLPTLLGLILRHAVALVGATSGNIRLWDPERQLLVPEATTGSARHSADVPLGLGEGVLGAAAGERRGLIVNDFRTSAYPIPALLEGTTHTAVMAVPLLYGERLVGVLGITRERDDPPFTEKDLEVLSLFAPQAAIAIENARLFQEQQRAFTQLEAAQEELVRAEKLRALGQMAAGVAHDLNNMLAAILGQAELLRLRVKLPEVQEALQVLYTAASDGAQVVRRLQEFGRQQPAASLLPCDLAPIVHEALELTRPRWQDEAQRQGRSIQVRTALDGLPRILGRPAELREALTNLILNAVDAMPHGGTLTLAGHADPAPPGAEAPARVCLTVTDTGIGMTEEVRRHIFDPFYTTKGLHGTGLGLAVVYGILERHGGRIDVASAPGQGTTFTLRFQAASAEADLRPAAGPSCAPAPQRILLIDDEDPVRATLADLLRAVGHDVVEAESGERGLARLAAHAVDLVITDLGMPEMTGWEVAQRVKAAHPRLPVILLTGWGQQVSATAPDHPCVDRILAKPVRLEDLLATIAACLDAGSAPA